MNRALPVLLLLACGPAPSSETKPVIDHDGRFFDAPFPSMKRLRDDGTIDVSGFPGPDVALKNRLVDHLGRFGEGFGRNTACWIRLSADIDPATLTKDSVYLLDLESKQVVPTELQFKAAQETYSPKFLLVALPVQGHVMAAGTWHALVVTRALHGADQLPVGRAAALDSPDDDLTRLKAALGDQKWSDVAGATVFRTGSHWPRLQALAQAARAAPATLSRTPFKLNEGANLVVLEGSVDVPMFQRGDEPYSEDGELVFDSTGAAVVQRTETVRFALSVPKKPMPAAGFPLLFHVPGSGGDYLAIVSRGAAGLGKDLAEHGIGAFGVEANLTSPRGGGGPDNELFYNVFNPVALRDNHRQFAAEYEVYVKLMAALTVDGALVPEAGAATLRFDASHFFMHGHSTGSVVGASILASNEAFSAGALSGAGGSWLYNLVLKQTPMTATLVKALLSYQETDTVDVFDPVLTLTATMWEPIEPMNQASGWARAPQARTSKASVLLIEGITDTFYLPRMVNALAMAGRFDVASPALDADTVGWLEQVGAGAKAPPFSANRDGVTLGLVQHAAQPGADGHYVVWDEPGATHQYACFFAAAAAGKAPVVAAPSAGGPCP